MPDSLTQLVERLRHRRAPDWKTLAMSYESAFRVMERKSAWMAQYLRARRTGDTLIGFFREQHFALKARGGE